MQRSGKVHIGHLKHEQIAFSTGRNTGEVKHEPYTTILGYYMDLSKIAERKRREFLAEMC